MARRARSEPEKADALFAQAAVSEKYVAPHQARECLEELRRRARREPSLRLADLMVQKGYLTKARRGEVERAVRKKAGPERVGRYELISKLGEGGMGTVFKARDTGTGGVVALKVLPSKLAEDRVFMGRFQREAIAVTRLDHPNIVRGLDVGSAGGSHYIAMEFIDGLDCDKMLARRGRLPEKEAVKIALQVAKALEYAHGRRLVHRDIKPANIIVMPNGTAKLTDLGLAKSTSATAAKLTQVGMTMGTPHYISPEQAMGSKDLDVRSDIYSLGATLYHLLTGRVPFDGSSPAIIVAKHLTEELPNPKDLVPELSDNLVRVLEKMLAKDRADRYSSPREMIGDFERIRIGRPPAARALRPGQSAILPRGMLAPGVLPRARARRPGQQKKRGAAWLVVGVLLGLALAGGVVAVILSPELLSRVSSVAREGWDLLLGKEGLVGWSGSGPWKAEGGLVECTGRGVLTSEGSYRDFLLSAEYSLGEGGEAYLVVRRSFRVRLPACPDGWRVVELTTIGPQVTALVDGTYLRPARSRAGGAGPVRFELRSGRLRLRRVEVKDVSRREPGERP